MENIEDICEASFSQEGLLFESIASTEPGLYVEQFVFSLAGPLDAGALRAAWERLAARHEVLRTCFPWQAADRPIQVIYRSVELPWTALDWRAVPAGEHEARLAAFVRDDLARGFDLEQAPLWRVALIHAADDAHWMVWTFHHTILDGWCLPLLFAELDRHYQSASGQNASGPGAPADSPQPRPYRDYVRWQRAQDLAPAEAFWRAELAGLTHATSVTGALGGGEAGAAGVREVELRLSRETSDALHALARRHRVTASTVCLGLWSLLLARQLDASEIVVGVATAGRPAELRGVEEMIGMFVGLVPARVAIAADRSLGAWLADVQAQQLAREQHGIAPLLKLQQWSGLPRGTALFDAGFVYENYPGGEQAPAGLDGGRIRVALRPTAEQTSYPLRLLVAPGACLGFRLTFDPARLAAATCDELGRQLGRLCERAAASFDQPVGELLALDRAAARMHVAAPAPAPSPATAVAPIRTDGAPRTDAERRLAAIWAEVLGRAAVGVHDNFISIGGDSIIAIQIVSRARRAGFTLTPRDLFERPTVAALAAVAERTRAPDAARDASAAEIPLTPIQRWFFAQPSAQPEHFNQAIALALAPAVDPARLQRALRAVIAHHDALRLRFVRGGDAGGWRQLPELPGAREDVPLDVPFVSRDLAALAPADQRAAIAADAHAWQHSLDLDRGPLMRIGHFDLGAGGGVLVWIAHHLIVDAVSWRVLLEDVEAAYRDRELPPVPTSLRRWSDALAARARSTEVARELERWLAHAVAPARIRPDGPDPAAADLVADQAEVTARLDVATTRALLQQAPAAYHTQINDLLLTALGRALAAATGASELRVDLEGHGREELGPDIDVSRTVGWFTTLFPLRLSIRNGEPGADIRAVKEALRGLPLRGLDYGLLAYLVPAAAAELAAAPRAQICFNYLGQLDASLSTELVRGLADVDVGPIHGPTRARPYAISIDSFVAGGALELRCSFGARQFRRATIEALAAAVIAALRDVVAHCLTAGAGGRTPSDFPAATLSQRDLDHLLAQLPDPDAIEDVYDLAPLQHGLLFEALYAPSSGANIEQFQFTLRGELARERFIAAWEHLIERHEVLRSSFHWERLQQPVQVVHRRAQPVWQELDWRALSAGARAAALAELLDADRRAGLAFDRATQCRFALIRTADDRHEFVWTFHHIVLDGWAMPLLLTELLALYEAPDGHAPQLAPPERYRSFITWCRAQDPAAAERFWRGYLAGAREATRLALPRPTTAPSADRAMLQVRVPAGVSAGLRELARRWQVTIYIALQGLWALLLHRHAGAPTDLLFAAGVSGRPPELPNVERIVGLFVNTVPVRARITAGSLREWLVQMQDEQRERERHAFRALPDIHGWSDVPRGRPLFESLIVYENYPVDEVLRDRAHLGGMQVESVRGLEQISSALTAIFEPGVELNVRLMYDATRFAADDIARLAGDLIALAGALVAEPERSVGELAAARLSGSDALAGAGAAAANDAPVVDVPVHVQFARHAARAPDALALTCGAIRMTYGELARAGARVTRELVRIGVAHEQMIGLLFDRSPEWIAATLGVLGAGAAFVPISPTSPDERARRLLAACNVRVVLTTRRHAARLDDGIIAVCVDELLAGPDDGISFVAGTAPRAVGPSDLAYVLFTSGSTGAPKGVAIEHGSVANLVAWFRRRFAVRPDDRASQLASIAFDASVWEVWSYLASGASLHLVPDELLLEPAALRDWLCAHAISIAFAPTALIGELVALPWPETAALRLLATGGDKLAQHPPSGLRFALVNLYGPTEGTVISTASMVPAAGAGAPSIGAAIDGTFVRVLDAELHAVEPGQAGELFIGGRNLARGYYGRPDLTAERFIADPQDPGGRLYRTGDLVRWRGDGLEFLGRADDQISLRGYRIEPGEVEAALAQHPAVEDALVMARGQDVARTLVGYVRLADGSARAGSDHHAQWQQLFDTTYGGTAGEPAALAFDTSGWQSNYTGAAIPAEEMARWVQAAVDEVERLAPRRVLEIGCGTGMLVARLAPGCAVYRAMDYSRTAVEQVAALCSRDPALAHVEVVRQAADDLSGCPDAGFDLVILNSVVQYFADADYLVRVLRGAARAVAPGGHIYVGDVRNQALLAAFHVSVALHRAPGALARDELRRRAELRSAAERELLVEPDFFHALVGRVDGIAAAEVELQRGAFHNEMTRFRYRALLAVGAPRAAQAALDWLAWGDDVADLAALQRRVAELGGDRVLAVRGVPNRRLATEAAALRWLDAAGAPDATDRDALAAAAAPSVDPEELWRLAAIAGHRVHLLWSELGAERIDVVIAPAAYALPPSTAPARAWSAYTNQVQVGASEAAVLHDIEAHARRILPAYMCPRVLVPVARWPLTSNGKIDRKALPDPIPHAAPADTAAGLRTPTERIVGTIWSEVLRVAIVDGQTDFFQAGGHSLSATQVVSRLLDATGVRISVRAVFEKPTVAALAEYVDSVAWLTATPADDADDALLTL